ncbi:MAG: ankyrin repeat domain-containing protein [Acidobacteriota bacterium]|nr:MAG: ankyrin repeat domain-containing protein [Acidobacteriota bacterium]
MSGKRFADSLRVATPCNEDWEQMSGNDVVRLCSHCSKHVNFVSQMTEKQARRLVRNSGGELCVRYVADPVSKRPLFAEQLVNITRKRTRAAAGAFSTLLAFATQLPAQQTPAERPAVAESQRREASPAVSSGISAASGARVSGTVTDPNGAVIPGAAVRLVLLESGQERNTVSNDEGHYAFEMVAPGRYMLESSSPGFRTYSETIVIREAETTKNDAEMDIEPINVFVDVVNEIKLDVGDLVVMTGAVAVTIEYTTPLGKAVADEDIDEVLALLNAGERPDDSEGDARGITPLFIAVGDGNLEIARALLDFGADVNFTTGRGRTPLMQIDDDATPELVSLLLSYKARVNVSDEDGDTPLILAAGEVEDEVLKLLIKAGADVNASNKKGMTALMRAAWDEDVEHVRMLLAAGAEVNAKNDEGETAWDLAAEGEVVKLIESYGGRSGDPEKKAKPQGDGDGEDEDTRN